MNRSQLALQAGMVGAIAGVLVEVLTLRLNPGIPTPPATLLALAALWATWGAATVGTVTFLALALVDRLRNREVHPDWWPFPELAALLFLAAAGLSMVNADLHADFLSGSGHRTLGQDGVTWIIAAGLALAGSAWVRRAGRPQSLRLALALALVALPLIRLASQPSPPRRPVALLARPLGHPSRPLLVIGLEGLDSNLLLTHATGGRYPALSRLVEDGAWGPVVAHHPYLRRSLWTTAATGASPRRHGATARWAYRLPGLDEPFRLLPWLPGGSRFLLPWGVARRELPPPALIPPLWERLRASAVSTAVLGWPGMWSEAPPGPVAPARSAAAALDPAFLRSLEAALGPFPGSRQEVWEALETDLGRTATARGALEGGTSAVWLHLETLVVARRELEPDEASDTAEREALDLLLEQLDSEVGLLLDRTAADALVAVVSPYGMESPGPGERLLRLLGLGGDWRATPRACPDGVVAFLGEGVAAPSRLAPSRLADVAPTLCYLLALPVAQYMDGRVILDAVDTAYLSHQPLRVTD